MPLVVSPLDNWSAFLRNPLEFIDTSLVANKITAESLINHHNSLSDFLLTLHADRLADIPLLNDANRLPDKSLVRFQCMVQDMFDPEFYLAVFETAEQNGTKGTGYGIYRDSFSESESVAINYESVSNSMQDRLTYLCIGLPGENKWVSDKRSKSLQQVELMDSSENDGSTVTEDSASGGHETDQKDPVAKRLKLEKEAVAKIRANVNQCFPSIDNGCKKLALVKVYDTRDPGLKLNDVIEVIGILDVDGEKTEQSGVATTASSEFDDNQFSLPAVVAPHIHVLHVKKLCHINPLVENSPLFMAKEMCEKIRKQLHAVLTLCLFGDELAAEYLICCLISKIYSRQDIINLGSLSVGFSNLPRTEKSEMRTYVNSLYQLISNLVTHSVYLPLSLETLNNRSFIPKKDHVSNKLVSGQLQLPAETVLFVDETALDAGKLEERGVLNIKSLGELIKWQQLKYDFQYHSMEVNTDMKIMVFSEGKSLLPLNFRVPLEVPKDVNTERVMQTAREYLDDGLMDQIRQYLTHVKESEYQIPESVQEQIQRDFVEMRQMDSKKVTADSLHSLLTLSRLMSISRGDRELSLETWDYVMRMEAARDARQSSSS